MAKRTEGVLILGESGTVSVFRAGPVLQLGVANADSRDEQVMVELNPRLQDALRAAIDSLGASENEREDERFENLADAVLELDAKLAQVTESPTVFTSAEAAVSWFETHLRPLRSMAE